MDRDGSTEPGQRVRQMKYEPVVTVREVADYIRDQATQRLSQTQARILREMAAEIEGRDWT